MALLAARLDPNDYTRLLFSSNVQVSSPQPDGSRILRLHTTLPAGVIIEPGVHLVDSRGASPNVVGKPCVLAGGGVIGPHATQLHPAVCDVDKHTYRRRWPPRFLDGYFAHFSRSFRRFFAVFSVLTPEIQKAG